MIKLTSLTGALTSRWLQFLMLPLLVLGWFAWTDPSAGAADTLLRVQLWAQALLITGVAYLVSKSLTGNVSGEGMGRAAMHGSIAAGLAFTGMCLLRGLVLLACCCSLQPPSALSRCRLARCNCCPSCASKSTRSGPRCRSRPTSAR